MALQFPSNPQVNDTYEAPNGVTYFYDGTKWSGHGVPSNVSIAEAAQDATAAMLAAGAKTNIAVTYHDDTNAMDLAVTIPTATDAVLGGIKVGNNLSITDGVLSATAHSPEVSTPTNGDTLDQTKQIFVLNTGSYTLADGTPGQICYFVMHSTGNATTTSITVSNIRVISSDAATVSTSAVWRPFDVTAGADTDAKTTVTAIFTEGAWNVSNGLVNP